MYAVELYSGHGQTLGAGPWGKEFNADMCYQTLHQSVCARVLGFIMWISGKLLRCTTTNFQHYRANAHATTHEWIMWSGLHLSLLGLFQWHLKGNFLTPTSVFNTPLLVKLSILIIDHFYCGRAVHSGEFQGLTEPWHLDALMTTRHFKIRKMCVWSCVAAYIQLVQMTFKHSFNKVFLQINWYVFFYPIQPWYYL